MLILDTGTFFFRVLINFSSVQGFIQKPRTHLIENSCEQLMQLTTSSRPGVQEGGELSNGDTTTMEYRYSATPIKLLFTFKKH
jgi:hypothetical protein